MTAPLWLKHPGIQELLNFLVDRLDKAEAEGKEIGRTLKLDAKSFPALYKAQFETDKEALWGYVEQLASLGWIGLKFSRGMPGQARYELEPRVSILDRLSIREAVGRLARVKSPYEVWREAVAAHLVAPAEVCEVAERYRIDIPKKSPAEVVRRLNELQALVDEPLLLREVSARLFWGMSKVLDGREPLVAGLLGMVDCPFPESPIQLQVYLPEGGFDGVLFIENQVTYAQALRDTTGRFSRMALVFAAGFKGSAKRLRSESGCTVFFAELGTLELVQCKKFLEWLRAGAEFPCWFWGDLDYSGMEILRALRGTFDGMQAWRPGYARMLAELQKGEGHDPEAAGKDAQRKVTYTGCEYADQVLLPALEAAKRFVDQEQV